jgi:Tfp pilus assembly protein PilV
MDEAWGVQSQQTWTFNGKIIGDRKNDTVETTMTGTKNETQQTTMSKVDIHVHILRL